VDSYRDHGNLVFIDLRDREGLTQLVFNPETQPEMHKLSRDLRCEYVIAAGGNRRPRGEGLDNPKLATGKIEVLIDTLEILKKAETPILNCKMPTLSRRYSLKYRYLDLRRRRCRIVLKLRHKVTKVVRDFFDSKVLGN
jgi:aspartyl-tRNA synthetase